MAYGTRSPGIRIAPPGKHLLSIFVQYAPYKLAEGNWDGIKEQFADRCIDALAEYAPNVPGAIEHRQVLSPVDLERTFGITGGNIMQGAMSPHQLFCFRPVAGWADHRTPIEGLYLCGAATHPGGGIMGAPGRNAAIRDAPQGRRCTYDADRALGTDRSPKHIIASRD